MERISPTDPAWYGLFHLQAAVLAHMVRSGADVASWQPQLRSFARFEFIAHYAAQELGLPTPEVDEFLQEVRGDGSERVAVVDLVGEQITRMSLDEAIANGEFNMVGSLVFLDQNPTWIYIQPVDIPQTDACVFTLPV